MLNTLGAAGAALKAAGAPGVFLQGLIVYGTGPEGAVIYERVLNQAVADKTVQVCDSPQCVCKYIYVLDDNCIVQLVWSCFSSSAEQLLA